MIDVNLYESVFKQPTNEYSAYWVGFLMADGCIKKTPKSYCIVNLELTETDLTHIEKFKKFVNSNNKIYWIHRNDKREKWSNSKPMVGLSITSQTMVNDLANYGVIPSKSKIADVMLLQNNKHFWRGLIDGDGSITSIHSGKNPSLEFAGSFNLVNKFAIFVHSEIFNHKSSVRKTKIKDFYKISFNGSSGVKVIKHLYENTNVSLDRKMSRAKHVLECKDGMYDGKSSCN